MVLLQLSCFSPDSLKLHANKSPYICDVRLLGFPQERHLCFRRTGEETKMGLRDHENCCNNNNNNNVLYKKISNRLPTGRLVSKSLVRRMCESCTFRSHVGDA